jgi:hypothetical protein
MTTNAEIPKTISSMGIFVAGTWSLTGLFRIRN